MNPVQPPPLVKETGPVLKTTRRPALLTRYFFVLVGVLALFFVLVGFSRTYFIPLATGTFRSSPLIHIHGIAFSLWILLAIVQPLLVQKHRIKIHRKLGVFGFGLAICMVLLGIATGIESVNRQIVRGISVAEAKAFLVLPLTDMLLFGSFIAVALLHLKSPATHKRLMVLATLAILPAAFGRLFPLIGITDLSSPVNLVIGLLMQESILFLGIAYDLITRKKIHPVYLWGGGLVIIVHLIRIPLGNTPIWQSFASWVTGL